MKHRIQWKAGTGGPAGLDYQPLLVHVAEGLAETTHPYVFVARYAFKELLEAEGGAVKATPLVRELIQPLRRALASKDADVAMHALEAVRQVSAAVGTALTPYLKDLVTAVARRAFKAKFRDAVQDTLQELEANGGEGAGAIIKKKVPTYQSL